MIRPVALHARLRRIVIAAAVGATMLAGCSGPPPAPPLPQPQLPNQPTGPTQLSNTDNQLVQLKKNGLMTYLEVAPIGSEAQVQLAVLAGSVLVAPGLAQLAATVLLESSDPTAGRPSLKHGIEALGGTVAAKVGLMTTWFDIRVHPSRMAKAISLLREALDSVTQSRSQIERMRGELVASLNAEIQQDPIPVAARMLLHAEHGTGQYLNSLLDLDPSQVSLFYSRLYRPEGCLLAVAAPKQLADIRKELMDEDATGISSWQPAPAVPGQPNVLERNFAPGLHWANVPGQPEIVRAAFVMRLPDPSVFGSAEWLVMHSCLTLGGQGGRLERMQDEAGLAHVQWRAHIEQTPDALALVLSTSVKHTEAEQLWRVLNRARQSLVEAPPTQSELRIALRRAQLNANISNLSSSERLRLAANMKTRGIPPGGLMARLLEMSDPAKWDPQKAAVSFQETPAWMVVVGAGRPDNLSFVVPFDLQPEGFAATVDNVPTPTAIAATGPWLTRARAAMGGGENFANLCGFAATSTIVADKTPDATDTVEWQHTGKLTRKRQILAQTISTELDGEKWSESLGTVRKSLESREAKLLRHEMMRHPMMLLAASERGTLSFRPIAQRSSGDRELMVLEAVGTEFDRLRIHIDTESYLIRTVESWERLPDESLVHVRESWSDYRAAGAMRAPYRCRATWNDGEHQTETQFAEWQPLLSK